MDTDFSTHKVVEIPRYSNTCFGILDIRNFG